MQRLTSPLLALSGTTLLAALACTSTTAVSLVLPITASVVVSPSQFLGDVPCGKGGAALYQATLIDVTEGAETTGEALPSSTLVSCDTDAYFESVIPGNRYIAEIQVYERSDLESAKVGKPGAADADGDKVAPTWTSTCWGEDARGPWGQAQGGAGGAGGAASDPLGVLAFTQSRVVIAGCERLARAE